MKKIIAGLVLLTSFTAFGTETEEFRIIREYKVDYNLPLVNDFYTSSGNERHNVGAVYVDKSDLRSLNDSFRAHIRNNQTMSVKVLNKKGDILCDLNLDKNNSDFIGNNNVLLEPKFLGSNGSTIFFGKGIYSDSEQQKHSFVDVKVLPAVVSKFSPQSFGLSTGIYVNTIDKNTWEDYLNSKYNKIDIPVGKNIYYSLSGFTYWLHHLSDSDVLSFDERCITPNLSEYDDFVITKILESKIEIKANEAYACNIEKTDVVDVDGDVYKEELPFCRRNDSFKFSYKVEAQRD